MILNPGKTEFDDQDHAEIRAGVQDAMKKDKLAQAEVARQTDVAASILSTYLRSEYTGDNNGPAAKLSKWLDARKREATMRLRFPNAAAFQQLGESGRIMQRFDVARAMGRLIMIGGAPGTSKTTTAQQYAASNNRVWVATMHKGTSGVPTMLLEILEAMGDVGCKGTDQALFKRICAKAMEAKGLIIVDEAQHLGDAAIEMLRAINDHTRALNKGIGVAIVGNLGVYVKVGATGVKEEFAQVSSRFSNRTWLAAPDPRDVVALSQAIADANREILGDAELTYLKEIASRPGGLRNIEMTFENALMAAIGTGQPLSLEHLQGAFAALSGQARAA